MAKLGDESFSDGLEIVSIGTLYAGQWDKKYWSSSRGKDRYPYPIGYQALRTLNGLTYTMEVHEGTKGPKFQITSNDKQSGSGETPDRAWGNFQKKGSRVKLWPGKRSTGKVDGVEFFGFKNALVQRLLRELVATINDASDQSSRLTNFSKASSKGQVVGQPLKYPSPELTPSFEKTRVTGKRSRTSRGVETKSACKRSHKICQPLNEADISKDPCYTRSTNNEEPMISSTSNLCEIKQADGPFTSLSHTELEKNVPLPGHGLPMKTIEVLDDSKAKSSLGDGQSQQASNEKCSSPSMADVNLPREEKSLDRRCRRVQGHGLSIATEDHGDSQIIIPEVQDSRPPDMMDSQVNQAAALCVPDTLDTQQDSGNGRENVTSRTELVADKVLSEEPISRSQSEDGSFYLTGNSEKSDNDTVGENFTKSMMAILLPQAVPCLTYSSRKKKRNARPSKAPCDLKSDDKLAGSIPCTDGISSASTHAKSDVEGVKEADPSTVHTDSAGLLLEYGKYVVPDSLDDNQSVDLAAKKLPPASNIGEKVAVDSLTYSSRKKKRKARPCKTLSCELKSDDKLAVKSDLEKVKGSELSSVHADPAGLVLENIKYVVPDSLDDNQFENLEAKKLPPASNIGEEVAVDFQANHEPYRKSLDSLNAAGLFCNNKISGCKHTFAHEKPSKDSVMGEQKDSVLASHSTVGCPPFIPINHFVEGEDHCSIAEAKSKFIEHSFKNKQKETIPNGKGKSSNNSADLISLSQPENSLPDNTHSKSKEYRAPLSESIICRNNGENCLLETNHGDEILVSSDSCQLYEISNNDRSKILFGVQGKLERQVSFTKDGNGQEALRQTTSHSIPQEQEHVLNCTTAKDGAEFIDGSDMNMRYSQSCLQKDKIGSQHCESAYQSFDPVAGGSQNCTSHVKEDTGDIGESFLAKQKSSEEMEGNMKLIGCYCHPMQVSSLKLAEIGHEIYICVSCGPGEDGKRELFLYKVSSKEPSPSPGPGCPCVIGHTSMRLPSLNDEFGREVLIDQSGIQFTPDAKGLVMPDSVRMPYCREKNLHCSCPQCESCFFEANAVKIVQIHDGYASVILKINTIYAVHCILVCEPNRLMAVDESGRIYIWIMDPTWSLKVEEHIILSYDFLPSRILELKRVPKSSSMVIGHNGYGQFSLWDMAKRTVVTQFSAPASSVLEYLPVSFLRLPNEYLSHCKLGTDECVKKLVEETSLWFSGLNKVNISCPTDGKDVALWALMYTSSDSNGPSASFSSKYHSNLDGCWRLCLLVKSTVIMGAALPSSTSAIGTSSGIGIIGTYKGHVDIWELATGLQLETLHHHAGKGVSHVAVDDSSSIVAIAHDGGELWVYRHQ